MAKKIRIVLLVWQLKRRKVNLVHRKKCIFDPLGQPTVTAGKDQIIFAHVVRTSSVRPHISKQNKFQAKTMLATGETVGLAEWIIDDTCLVWVAL